MKDQIPVMDLPLLGKTKKLPFPATLFTAVIVAVRMFPAFVFFLCIPDYLRVRADQEVIAPPPEQSITSYSFQPSAIHMIMYPFYKIYRHLFWCDVWLSIILFIIPVKK